MIIIIIYLFSFFFLPRTNIKFKLDLQFIMTIVISEFLVDIKSTKG